MAPRKPLNPGGEPVKLFWCEFPPWFAAEVLALLRVWGLWGCVVVCGCGISVYSAATYGGPLAAGLSDRFHAEAARFNAEAEAIRANQIDQQAIINELRLENRRLGERLERLERDRQ